MNVVFVASEAVPFAKTGGLADVAGALPRALERLGHTVALIVPCYRQARQAGLPLEPTGLTLRIPVGEHAVEGFVLTTQLPGSNVPVYLIDQPAYFDRPQLYHDAGRDYPDNCERFAFFCRAVLETVRRLGLCPDVVHCNDWQTGLIPVYLDEFFRRRPGFGALGTLFTIHNLAYQGRFPASELPRTGLHWRLFTPRHLEFYGLLNFMKAGLVFSDMISTVSPTYAGEIQRPALGCGLDGLLHSRRDDLRGIVNGIDLEEWSPAHESMIAQRYDVDTVTAGKPACKAHLQRLAGLPEVPTVPLLAQIGRLDPQKGWDLLADVADDLLRGSVQMVVLGQGLPRYHRLLERLAGQHPDKLRVFLEFSKPLAHQIEAGADLFLMPSLYEPCGLNQLYSLVHGTVPLVHATGGLADTVVDATPQNLVDGTATGFVFQEPAPWALREALDRALRLWPDRETWLQLMRNGMRGDWSWHTSARAYIELYESVRQRAKAACYRRTTQGMVV